MRPDTYLLDRARDAVARLRDTSDNGSKKHMLAQKLEDNLEDCVCVLWASANIAYALRELCHSSLPPHMAELVSEVVMRDFRTLSRMMYCRHGDPFSCHAPQYFASRFTVGEPPSEAKTYRVELSITSDGYIGKIAVEEVFDD